ncbi:MAG: 6-phosphogluconolactonase [Gallionellaceae bacterium]|nr:6-phosphogluconolactonase [Gallionellaceae bacterium]
MSTINGNSSSQLCRWHSFANTAELEKSAVTEILRAAHEAIQKRGSFHIVLAGGTTPRRVYELLKTANTNWAAWHIYFGDERCLPIDHAERNSLMATQAWLNSIDIPTSQIHPIPAEEGPLIAAEKYAALLSQVATFDLVLLGLGEDGHTASLFPQHDVGNQANSPATLAVFDAPKPPPQRVSLSAKRLSDAHQVIFLVTGNSKKEAVKNWRAEGKIPASTVTPKQGVDIYIESQLLD